MIEIKDTQTDQETGRPVLPEIKNPEVLEKAIQTYGVRAQVDMAVEEMSELTKALLKHRRGCPSGTVNDLRRLRENIVEETADVIVMIAQMIMMYDYRGDVQAEVDFKINRLRERLKEG